MLTAIAAFAEAFTNPLAPLLVLGLALLVARPWLVRALAVGAGCVLSLAGPPRARAGGELVLSMLGAAAALLLHAEIAAAPDPARAALAVALSWSPPGSWAWLMLAPMLRTLWHRPRRPGTVAAEEGPDP